MYLFNERGIDRNDPAIVPGLFAALEGLPTSVNNLAPGPGFNPGAPITPGVPGGKENPVNAALDNELATYSDLKIDNAALYSHLDWSILSDLKASFGLRGTYERKTYTGYYYHRAAQYYSLPPTEKTAHFTNVTPHLGIDYTPVPNNLFYASYDRGFKSGTFNGRANAGVAFQEVRPETVDTVETGWKTKFNDNRARLSVAAFYSIYKDIQLSAITPSATSVNVFLINAARAKIYGLETEFQADLTDSLLVGATGGYDRSRITQIDPAIAAETDVNVGDQLKKTPKTNFSLFGEYRLPVSYGQYTWRTDYAWRSERYHDSTNKITSLEGSVGLLNSRLAWQSLDKTWDVFAHGNNITNRVVYSSIFLNGGGFRYHF